MAHCQSDRKVLIQNLQSEVIQLVMRSKMRQEDKVDQGSIRFMVATDIHLGHKEKHPVRKNDSFEALDQILENAKTHDVDFLLLGGDLFDQVNPSSDSLYRCLSSLRNNIYGARNVKIDVTLNGEQYPTILSNKDINISLPILTIHGNHDYPASDFGKTSVCDLLQASNFVVYFGKSLDLHAITIRPLIITKKNCKVKLALYGLGYIKDPILNDLFHTGKAVFQKPVGDISQYLTIFVLHQNRYKKGYKAGVPQASSFSVKNIPEWINLTIWGHEHEAIYKPEFQYNRCIFQPGSTVLTSFIQAESLKKQCVLINTQQKNFKITSILLEKSFRPMYIRSLELALLKSQHGQNFDLIEYLDNMIGQIIEESMKENQFKKPIIRIKVEYTGMGEIVRATHLQKKYCEVVANNDQIIYWWKRKVDKKIDITDDQMIDTLKKKKTLPVQKFGIQEQVDSLIKINLDNAQFTCNSSKDFYIELAQKLTEAGPNITSVVKKSFAQKDTSEIKEETLRLAKQNKEKELEFRSAMKYLSDKRAFINFGTIPQEYKDEETFKAKEGTILNSSKYETYCKIMEEKVDTLPIRAKSKKTRVASENVNRGRKMEEETSFEFEESREESLDCCQKAARQEIDEQSNRHNFHMAEKMAEKMAPRSLKLNADLNRNKNKKTSLPPVSKRANTTSVPGDKKIRFSEDLI